MSESDHCDIYYLPGLGAEDVVPNAPLDGSALSQDLVDLLNGNRRFTLLFATYILVD